MRLASNTTQRGRNARVTEEWGRLAPVVEELNQSSKSMEFYLHLHGKYRATARYVAQMTPDARERYGRQLQAEAHRIVELDTIGAAAGSVVGLHIESGVGSTPECRRVHAQSRRMIDNAIALYGDESDFDAAG